MSAILSDAAIGAGARALWQEDLLLDYTIQVQDEQFMVHKVIMASVSDYFKVMLTGGMVESQTDRVRLEGLDPGVVSDIINYIYTGQLAEKSVSALKDLLGCAVYLQIPTAVEKCTHDLCEKVDENNCLDILSVFKSYSLDNGITHTTQYIKANNKEVLEACKFSEISYQDVLTMIDCWQWLEWNLFAFVHNWINSRYVSRKEHVDDLMARIRFCLMSATQLASFKEKRFFFKSDLPEKALSYHNLPTHLKILDESEQARVRSDPTLVCFGRSLTSVHALQKGNSWRSRKTLGVQGRFEINPKAAVVVNNFIICYENWGFRWHMFDTQSQTWSRMESNYLPHRQSFALVHHNQHLYVLGGADDGGRSLPDTIQKYDIKENRWQVIDSKLPVPLLAPSAFSISDAIYMLGGKLTGDVTPCLPALNCFHPSSGAWENKAPMLETSASNRIQLVELSETVIAVLDASFTIQYYKPSTDQWAMWRNVGAGLSHLLWNKMARPVTSGNSLFMFNYRRGNTEGACEKWTFGENGLEKVERLPDLPPDNNPSISVLLSI